MHHCVPLHFLPKILEGYLGQIGREETVQNIRVPFSDDISGS